MSENFMGLGGIADRELLRSGMEAIAIGFPLDGPVRDATLLSLKLMRHAQKVEHNPEYLTFLAVVQARYPDSYAQLANEFADHLGRRSTEIGQTPLLLMRSQMPLT